MLGRLAQLELLFVELHRARDQAEADAVAAIDGRVPPSPPSALWARVASPGVSFALKVAEPPPHDLDPTARRLIEEAKSQAARSRQGAIDWVGAKDHADVVAAIRQLASEHTASFTPPPSQLELK